MKVIAIHGSPRKQGNSYYALTQVGKSLQAEGIDFEIVQVGDKFIQGCKACGKCKENKDGKCDITDDVVNDTLQKMKEADGIVLSTPVYYSGIAGTMKCFLDRVFSVSAANGRWFRHKVGASVVAVRRSGGSMAFDGLNRYLAMEEMLVPSSNYLNIIHGLDIGDAEHDTEGIQIMQLLGKNMAWMLKMREKTQKENIEPEAVEKIKTNFIR
ncbi:2-amino-4-deoxychorismate dehydrogenase [termite gut metagenome]|uniref:2-amino-4-deoxychorismate dehydrogenase n=1 Tax=termite gut metagenome TaxID=433724 RepID=A0A5J4QCP4_9ZZZZ